MPDPQSPVRATGRVAAKEPLLAVGAVTAAVTAILSALVAFGLHLSHDQVTAILAVVAALAPLVAAVVGRGRVYSPATVRKMLLRQQ